MNKITFYHISDLHIGQNNRRTEAASHVTDALLRMCKPMDYLFVTGDVIDNGNSKFQQSVSEAMLFKLSAKYRTAICEGNHDVGFYGLFRTDFTPNYSRVSFTDAMNGVDVFILNSMAGEVKTRRFGANGSLGEQQLRDLDSWLNQKSDAFRVVLLHHHPFYSGAVYRLRDADAFKEIVNGRVSALLFGHMHDEMRLFKKEEKYKIPVIHAAGSATDLNRGISGKAVYRIKRFTLSQDGEVNEETVEVE